MSKSHESGRLYVHGKYGGFIIPIIQSIIHFIIGLGGQIASKSTRVMYTETKFVPLKSKLNPDHLLRRLARPSNISWAVRYNDSGSMAPNGELILTGPLHGFPLSSRWTAYCLGMPIDPKFG